jgi:hypothetical protein
MDHGRVLQFERIREKREKKRILPTNVHQGRKGLALGRLIPADEVYTVNWRGTI